MALHAPVRTPVTDLSGRFSMTSEYQVNPRSVCALVETRLMECVDSYGYDLAKYKCRDYTQDFFECFHAIKQAARANIMRRERYRQYLFEGKRPLYAEPPQSDIHFWW